MANEIAVFRADCFDRIVNVFFQLSAATVVLFNRLDHPLIL